MKNNIKRIISILLIITMLLSCTSCAAFQPQWEEIFTGNSSYGTITVSKKIEDYSIYYIGQLQFTITSTKGETYTFVTDTHGRLVSEPTVRYICSRDGHPELYTIINYIEKNTDTSRSTLDEIDPGSGNVVEMVSDLVDTDFEGFGVTLLTGLISAIGTCVDLLGFIVDNVFSIFDFIDQVLSSNKPIELMAEKFIEIITSLDNTSKKAIDTITGDENPVDAAYDLLYVAIENAYSKQLNESNN